jgi:HD-GYP domain-containing protein (c-di-GMP phosphodiesterase class II)
MKIVCIEGNRKGSVWELTGSRHLIGRDPTCDIHIDDPGLSRIHAEVVREGDDLVFADRGSLNGSFINHERVTRKVLFAGDIIRLGGTTSKVVGKDLSPQFLWQENDPFITTTLSLDHFNARLKELVSAPRDQRTKKPTGDLKQSLHTAKLIKNLDTIYRVGNTINTIQNVDEILEQIAETLLAVFLDVERVCILLKGSKGASHFEPKIIKTRLDVSSGPFQLSRSIISKSVGEEKCILAGDAHSDERFLASQSVMSMNIRSVMCVPLLCRSSVLGVIYLDNRNAPNRFDEDDLALLSALANQCAVAIENSQLYEEVQKGYHEAILALMNTVNAKDAYTRGHSRRTSRYAVGIAREMGLSEEECEKVRTAADLHDIGKIGVGDFIIGKESALSTMEYNSVQAHVLTGENIVKPITYLRFTLPMIRHHHEHYDGSGYPDRLKGDQIPLGARIIGAADAFDAMTSQRPYNQPLPVNEALEKCVSLKGKQFDPGVIDALLRFVNRAGRNVVEAPGANAKMEFAELNLGAGAS